MQKYYAIPVVYKVFRVNDPTTMTPLNEVDRSRPQNLIARLPLPLLRYAGALVGMGWYAFHRTHRKTVQRNIAFAFPQWEKARVHRTVRKAFRCFGLNVLENVQISVMTRDEIVGRCRIEGSQHLIDALALNRGVFMIAAHLGNWEIGLQMMTCYFNRKFLGVAKKFKNKHLDQWIHRMRTRQGSPVVYKKGARTSMSKALRQGEITGVHIDISRQEDGIDVEFFGYKATATPAAALLALRHKCPVLPMTCLRDPDGKIAVCIGKPFELIRTKNLREDLRTNTQIMTDSVEQSIRQHPEQWWWIQKRWKDYYPGLYPEHYRKRVKNLRHRLARKKQRMKAKREERRISDQ